MQNRTPSLTLLCIGSLALAVSQSSCLFKISKPALHYEGSDSASGQIVRVWKRCAGGDCHVSIELTKDARRRVLISDDSDRIPDRTLIRWTQDRAVVGVLVCSVGGEPFIGAWKTNNGLDRVSMEDAIRVLSPGVNDAVKVHGRKEGARYLFSEFCMQRPAQ
jgi:hypothetical protein